MLCSWNALVFSNWIEITYSDSLRYQTLGSSCIIRGRPCGSANQASGPASKRRTVDGPFSLLGTALSRGPDSTSGQTNFVIYGPRSLFRNCGCQVRVVSGDKTPVRRQAMDIRNPASTADTRNPVSSANVMGHPLHPILITLPIGL